jgi:protein-tyrosine phosphatase
MIMSHNNSYHEIINYLYNGNSNSLKCEDIQFTTIVNCTKDIPFPSYCKPENCIRIPINDNPDECQQLLYILNENNVLEKINNSIINKEPVLVHCSAGMQRSCAVVACYLMKYYNLDPNTAILHIQSRRPIAFFGNINFLNAIIKFKC